MAYFPKRRMPKTLKRETTAEVDGSPLVYNARDYNILVREVLAIEEFLGSEEDAQQGRETFASLLRQALGQLEAMTDGGLIRRHSAAAKAGGILQVPASMTHTTTVGELADNATTIVVDSTDGFPSSGYITKINAISTNLNCDGNVVTDECSEADPIFISYNLLKHNFNYELISYTSKTDTTFEGCVREVAGAAAEVPYSASAVIISGRASLSLTHNFWGKENDKEPETLYARHNADLMATGALYSASQPEKIDKFVELAYCITVSGGIDSLDTSSLLSGR
jgi:hypothetical protein